MLVCFDVSPELPNNSPKVAICLFTSEPAIEEVKFEVFFSSVADTTIRVRTQRKALNRSHILLKHWRSSYRLLL